MTDYSYQLYSSRNFGPMAETLRMVAEAGYAYVEGYGSLYASPGDLADLGAQLRDNGLKMPTGHFGLDQVEGDRDRVMEIVHSLGMEAVIVPSIKPDDRGGDAEGWAAVGRRLAEAGKPFQDAGIVFGYHNHDFEFADLGGPDKPLDLILADNPMQLQFDVAWAVRGGEDPAGWIEKYRTRLLAAHVKDIAPEGEAADEDGWADVGHGTMDWPALMARLRQTTCKYYVMEHDNPSDDARFAKRSIAAAKEF